MVKRAVQPITTSHGSYHLLTFHTGCSRFGVHLVTAIYTCSPVFTYKFATRSQTAAISVWHSLIFDYSLSGRWTTAVSLQAFNHRRFIRGRVLLSLAKYGPVGVLNLQDSAVEGSRIRSNPPHATERALQKQR